MLVPVPEAYPAMETTLLNWIQRGFLSLLLQHSGIKSWIGKVVQALCNLSVL